MLKNRVLATSGLLFALGVGVAVYLPAFTLYLAVGSLCVLCIYLCAVRIFAFKAKIKRTLLYCVVPIAAAGFTMLYTSVFITPYYALEGRDIKGEAVVGEVRMFGYSGYADVTVTSSDIAVADGMSLRLYLNAEMLLPSYGDTVSFSARLTVPEKPESLFADRTLLVGNDVTLYSFRPTAGVLWRMRSAVSGIIDDIFADSGSGVAPLMKAVVLSDFSSLTEDKRTAFFYNHNVDLWHIKSNRGVKTHRIDLMRASCGRICFFCGVYSFRLTGGNNDDNSFCKLFCHA